MKKICIRLLAFLLTAVMIFPASAFATATVTPGPPAYPPAGGTIDLFVGKSQQIAYDDYRVVGWDSNNVGVATVTSTGLVTAVSSGTAIIRAYDSSYNTVGATYTVNVSNAVITGISIKVFPKQNYISGQKLDTSDLVVTVTYDSGDTREVGASSLTVEPAQEINTTFLPAGSWIILVKYQGFTTSYEITVAERTVISIECVDEKTKYEEGDSFMGVKVRVNYSDGSHDVIVEGYTVSPETAAKTTTSYTVTYRGFTATRTGITVTAKPSGGGSGGGTTPTENTLRATVTRQPTKKAYKVGETFDTTGMEVEFRYTANNQLYTTLSAADLARYISYTFKNTDVTTGTNTLTLNFKMTFEGKIYEFNITGFTVTAAKKTLNLSVNSRHEISNIFVQMKRKSYPIGANINLSDIEYVSGRDASGYSIILEPADFADYGHTFSIEVMRISNGATVRKTTRANTIESSDVLTSGSNKIVYLRLYIDQDFVEFDVDSGESGVSVYYGTTLLEAYDKLSEALTNANDLNHGWGSSATKYTETRKLTLKLGQDAELSRYEGQIALNRDIDIDLNGHKLTLYSDAFVFLDKRQDIFKATVTNTASETAKLVYQNQVYDQLLIDKSESIVYKYQEDKDANLPGIYTLTVEELKNGAVVAKPVLNAKNIVYVSHGNDVTFTITPDKDYEIDAVKVKGANGNATTVSVNTNKEYSVNSAGVATYTMKDIKADATLTATFKTTKKPEEEQKPTTPVTDDWKSPFSDVPDSQKYTDTYKAVEFVYTKGLMNGTSDTTFGPNETMTRAQFVTTLGRMYLSTIFTTVAEKDAAMIRQYGTDSQFSDVSYADGRISYAVPYIKWAESSGLVQGYGNGKFGPYDTITHQQMYIIMYRYAQTLANKTINVSNVVLRATDADQLGEGWLAAAKEGAIAAAKYAQQQSFLVNSTRISPNGNALRSELAILLMQFSKNVLGWQ